MEEKKPVAVLEISNIKNNEIRKVTDDSKRSVSLKYIRDKYEIFLNQNLDLLSGKNRFLINLSKKWSFFGLGNLFKFGCCSCKQINDSDEFIFEEEKNYNTNIEKDLGDSKNINKCKKGYFKYKDDDSYNDYILYLNHIIGVSDDETSNINISTNNNKQKEESLHYN